MLINGAERQIHVDPERTLLNVVRDDLGLTGSKVGCGDGKCGACTLLVNGQPVQSCSMTVGAAAGSHIMTIEGLAQAGQLHVLQAAFLETGAFQCGYCTAGMISRFEWEELRGVVSVALLVLLFSVIRLLTLPMA